MIRVIGYDSDGKLILSITLPRGDETISLPLHEAEKLARTILLYVKGARVEYTMIMRRISQLEKRVSRLEKKLGELVTVLNKASKTSG